ncbi:hypothetical protein AB0537_001262 [Vibrio parahaemolyticus]
MSDSASAFEYSCSDLAGFWVYGKDVEKTIAVENPVNPITNFSYGDKKCIAKPYGTSSYNPENPREVTAVWRYTGETYEPPKSKIFVTVEHRISKHRKDIYADNKEELCKRLIEPAKNEYYAIGSNPESYGTMSLWNQYYHHGIISGLESENSSYWNRAYCRFTYYDKVTDADTARQTVNINNIASYTPPANADEPCPSGESRNPDTLQCEMPARQESEKCEAGIEREFSPIKIQPISNINVGGCHMEKTSVKFAAHNLPKTCVSAKYVSTGKLARSDDYTYKQSDYCAADELPSCLPGFKYHADQRRCYSDDGNYKSYNPDLVDDTYEAEELIEGATDLPPEREGDAEGQFKPEEGESVKCEQVGNEFEKETICSIVNEDGSYNRPASREEYPSDTEISDGICGNGFTGSNCDEEPILGGSSGGLSNGTGDRGTTESVNDNLEGLLEADKIYNINYDTIGGELEGEEGNESESSVDIASLFNENKGTLQEVAECPASSSIVFFEGVEFLGTSIDKEFTLSYENVCGFGNNYKDIYLNILLLLLALDLIRKMRGK